MKLDDAIETLSRFFNDLIGSLVPGMALTVGLAVMHLGPSKIAGISKSLEGAAVAVILVGLMFAAGHVLMALFDHAIRPTLLACKLIKRFDEANAKKRQSYEMFIEIFKKQCGSDTGASNAQWGYNDLRSVALSVSAEGASLGRRFMFISLLCNGVGTALVIMLIDFLSCLALNQKLLFSYADAAPWAVQAVLMLGGAIVLFKRGETFYERAMATPFSIAIAELKLKRDDNVAK